MARNLSCFLPGIFAARCCVCIWGLWRTDYNKRSSFSLKHPAGPPRLPGGDNRGRPYGHARSRLQRATPEQGTDKVNSGVNARTNACHKAMLAFCLCCRRRCCCCRRCCSRRSPRCSLLCCLPPTTLLPRSGAVPAGERPDDRLHARVPGEERRAGGLCVLRQPRQAARGVPPVFHLGGAHGGTAVS